jgi:membrane associated rhomboid family serine protease
MDGCDLVALRVTRRRASADEWALVLAAEGLSPCIRGSREGFVLEVAAGDVERAERALAAFEGENRRAPPPPDPPPVDRHPLRHALVVASALLASFAWTGPAGDAALGALGDAEAGRIRAGEWWRAVTALTLHADAGHVLGNAVAGALFLTAVFRGFGPGVGGALVLASGVGGNLANAAFRAPLHATVGASTAVFGALGVAVGAMLRRPRAALRGRPFWLPVGAALALLAMLGTEGERVDVWAHAMGLAAGVAIGAAAAQLPAAWLTRASVQALAALAAIALLAIAWRLALQHA